MPQSIVLFRKVRTLFYKELLFIRKVSIFLCKARILFYKVYVFFCQVCVLLCQLIGLFILERIRLKMDDALLLQACFLSNLKNKIVTGMHDPFSYMPVFPVNDRYFVKLLHFRKPKVLYLMPFGTVSSEGLNIGFKHSSDRNNAVRVCV